MVLQKQHLKMLKNTPRVSCTLEDGESTSDNGFLVRSIEVHKNFMYTLPFLLQRGCVSSEEATVDFRRKTLQEKKLQNQHQ